MQTSSAVQRLDNDLRGIFGPRLRSLSIYGRRSLPTEAQSAKADAARDASDYHSAHGHQSPPTHTLAVVDGLSRADLRACAERIDAWHEAGLATPLLVGAHEFEASLDAFPLEFGAMIADHVVVAGSNPFEGLSVDPADLRRAVEVHARGHLLHLREGFIETRGRSDALSVLIVSSAPAMAALVLSVARLEGQTRGDPAAAARHAERTLGLTSGILADIVALTGVREISSADADRLFTPYLEAVERLVAHVDSWRK
ncbi:MAG TPA: hypothetical protein VGY57_02345 [Vicinamibacterales bacterium]|nr:hypothetical protein [Vicinamibacterales bacterium]